MRRRGDLTRGLLLILLLLLLLRLLLLLLLLNRRLTQIGEEEKVVGFRNAIFGLVPTSVLTAPQGSTMMPERARWEPNILYSQLQVNTDR